MFIVFEGIDGSGKTTLSNLVARTLSESGLRVEHVRAEGRYASGVAQAMRELGRDVRNLALCPDAELLLLAAREAQLFAECTRPALERADVVIADRFLYSAEVLACEGRGLERERVRTLLRAAVSGVVPDLVFLVDVDPQIARARRRVTKIVAAGDSKPPSRKGLAGAGLQRLLRAGYLALAHENPSRWIVCENDDDPVAKSADRIATWVRLAVRHGARAAVHAAANTPRTKHAAPTAESLDEAAGTFLRWIDQRATLEPSIAAYFLAGLSGPEVEVRRRALASLAPEVVAEGLTGLSDSESWRLREVLAGSVPRHVARSLRNAPSYTLYADLMRRRLSGNAPGEVANSIAGRDDASAWSLRELLAPVAPKRVIASLAGLDSPRAWEWRTLWGAARSGDSSALAPLCESIRGIPGDPTWSIREEALASSPLESIASIGDLTCDRSWEWRTRFASTASKVVMRTLHGSDDPRAWTLRRAVASRCKEALDSITGLDSDPAWAFRLELADRWPSTVVKSLGPILATSAGRSLLARQLNAHAGDLSLLKHAAASQLEEPAIGLAAIHQETNAL